MPDGLCTFLFSPPLLSSQRKNQLNKSHIILWMNSKARKKIGKLIQKQTAKLSDYFQEFIYNRHGRIKLIDDDQVEGPTSLSGSRVSLSAERLQPLDLSHHHQLPSQLATVSRLQDDDQEEDDDEEDNEVLPPVRYSKK